MKTSRRELLKLAGQGCLAAGASPVTTLFAASPAAAIPGGEVRCINVVNFIREIEGRFSMDMMAPVTGQMNLIRQHGLPATWLLQFDALVEGPFVPFLQQNMTSDHEVGFWFEMNQRHCEYAGIPYRGSPSLEWDPNPSVAFTLGYAPADRIKLADVAMTQFKKVWGRYPASVASWNLDAVTMSHLSDNYGIDAFAICRDQFSTDGFSIWGGPIGGYYPSKLNSFSPAIAPSNQIGTPVFRMLGQDPVHYYDGSFRLPDGSVVSSPDTMEPAWRSGQDPAFVAAFLDMIESAPTGRLAYAQLGQENTFPWEQQSAGYAMQMDALARLRQRGTVNVETLGASGRRFKGSFAQTPAQAQVMVDDPFGNTSPAAGSVWYQGRLYRVNCHIAGDLPYLRDLFVYSDRQRQPFLDAPATSSSVEQQLLGVMDGYHWSQHPGALDGERAGIFLYYGEQRVRLAERPRVYQIVDGGEPAVVLELPLQGVVGALYVWFLPSRIFILLGNQNSQRLSLRLECDASKSPIAGVSGNEIRYSREGFDYRVRVGAGTAQRTDSGWQLTADGGRIELDLAQD